MPFKIESVYSTPTLEEVGEGAEGRKIAAAVEHYQAQHAGIAPYFIGPQAENHEFFSEYIKQILDEHKAARERYHGRNDPKGENDGKFITKEMKKHPSFEASKKRLEDELNKLFELLMKHSVPFFNPRYQAHMSMDTSMPAVLGYITTMIFNPNNVSLEASPVTTILELEAGKQLCKMLGFRLEGGQVLPGFPGEVEPPLKPGERVSWGHITCGGTVANMEGLWAARNLKFYPLSLRNAMAPGEPLEFIASTFKIPTCKDPDNPKLFQQCSLWELLNLTVDTILEIPELLYRVYGISSTYLASVMELHSIQTCGKDDIENQYHVKPMRVLVSNTNHYSWPKGCALLGIGSKNMIGVKVDNSASLDLGDLEKILEDHLKNEQGIYCVVAILGSTEEGAVDDLKGILRLRSDFQKRGLSFAVHIDAAWGGYFASLLPTSEQRDIGTVPSCRLRPHVEQSYRNIRYADSITIDPHKSGYVPYPAGALCYRDGRMRYLVTWTSPYIAREHQPESIGVFGVEGSKPGAAAVATYMSNSVIGMRETGYGVLLGEALFSSSRLSAHWAAMSTDDDEFMVVPFNLLPSERDPNHTKADIEAEKEMIRRRILPVDNINLLSDPAALELLRDLGSDLVINIFSVNFKLSNGEWNTDVEEANYLNKRIVKRLSYVDPSQELGDVEFFLTSTEFQQKIYLDCATNYKRRLGLELEGEADLFVMRNVVMSPFPTDRNFVSKLANIFRRIVEEEVKICQLRNSLDPAIHRFFVQGTCTDSAGTGKLYLAYQPFFHETDCLTQLIVSAEIQKDAMDAYLDTRSRSTKYATFHLETNEKLCLPDILKTASFTAKMTKVDLTKEAWALENIAVSNITVVKNRNLKDLDSKYPSSFMPFYLYGTAADGGQHVSHMLLKSPNINLCADNISLSLNRPLSDLQDHLKTGCIAYATDIFESSRQPFSKSTSNIENPQDPSFFFVPNRTLAITVYADPLPADSSGSGLLTKVDVKKPLATGTMKLDGMVYVDAKYINMDGLEGLLWDGSAWSVPPPPQKGASGPILGVLPPIAGVHKKEEVHLGVGLEIGRSELGAYWKGMEKQGRATSRENVGLWANEVKEALLG